MYWAGEYPDANECSRAVDKNFFLEFLKTRPCKAGGFCNTLFNPAEDKGHGWQFHSKKLDTVENETVNNRRAAGWEEGYHASYWACVHDVVCNGLKEGPVQKQEVPGVYHFQTLQRTTWYHRYQLLCDGTAWCRAAGGQ